MSISSISGQKPNLYQFLQSLGTSGTSPSQPLHSADVAANGTAPGAAASGAPASAAAGATTQQMQSAINAALNALTSNQTANPQDALQSMDLALSSLAPGQLLNTLA